MHPTGRSHVSSAMVYTMGRFRTLGRELTGEFLDPDEDLGVSVIPKHDSIAAADLQGTALEAGSVVIDHCLSRIFVAAYLLAGNARQAEAAVSESIERLDLAAARNGRLSWKTIAAAIMRSAPDSEPTSEEAPIALPVELQRVLRLSPRLRQCFVLRVLMAMPRHYCAGLLCVDAGQVEANSCLAARELASMAAVEATN